MLPLKPNLLVLITRLFCSPVKQPGAALTGAHAVGSTYTIDPILRDFVEYVTVSDAFPEGSSWNPGQVSYKIGAYKHLVFHLPVSLREFVSDLMPFLDALPTRISTLSPIRADDFDAKGRRRALFLCTHAPEGVQELTPASEWLRSMGYDSLRDLFSKTKNETERWLSLVHGLNIPTKALSSDEMCFLIEIIGDGPWVKAITVRVDTSFWLPRGTSNRPKCIAPSAQEPVPGDSD